MGVPTERKNWFPDIEPLFKLLSHENVPPYLKWDMHGRNKTAMGLIAKGWSNLKEVDRVIHYCKLNDLHLIPLLRLYHGMRKDQRGTIRSLQHTRD